MATTLPDGLHPRHRFARARPRAKHAAMDVHDDDRVLAEIIAQQEAKVLALARTIVPRLTLEDVRNPHDFPALVASADFNYEDGILAGLKAAEMALRAARRASSAPPPK